MAGTFTHWMVVEEALDKYNQLLQKHHYFPPIQSLNHFVCLGAVGPDYPYLTELLNNILKVHSWADRMHYENTGEFINWGIKNLHLPNLSQDAFNICLAWLCGFSTHLVTDSIIHPVVNSIVGPYIFNKTEHRHCEMTQDSFIFHEIKGIEIEYGNYFILFKMCSSPADKNTINPFLGEFWSKTLKASHPAASHWFDKIVPDTWHKNFLSKISSASDPIAIFRHIAEEEHLAYKKTTEITPEERERFINSVKLPGNKTGQFKKDAFDKTVDAIINTWSHLFVDIENNNPNGPAAYIKDWNLDTGVDEDEPYFWSDRGRAQA